MKQARIAETPDEDPRGESKTETVYVVASCYADDPHPHVEAVYSNKDSAELHRKEIADDIRPSAPVAWQVLEQEVDPHE